MIQKVTESLPSAEHCSLSHLVPSKAQGLALWQVRAWADMSVSRDPGMSAVKRTRCLIAHPAPGTA